MNELMQYAFAWSSGLILGGVFFGGLWWTVMSVLSGKLGPAWLLVSWLLRMAVAMTGFYLVGREHWQLLLTCLLGFVMARAVVKWLTQLWENQQVPQQSVSKNAS